MIGDSATLGIWLLRSAVGGSLVLILVSGLVWRIRQPVRRQRLGEWGIIASLLVVLLSFGPSWVYLPISLPGLNSTATSLKSKSTPSPETFTKPEGNDNFQQLPPIQGPENQPSGSWLAEISPNPSLTEARVDAASANIFSHDPDWNPIPTHTDTPAPDTAETKSSPIISMETVLPYLLTAYLVAAAFFLARWLIGSWALARWLRNSETPPVYVAELFQSMVSGRWKKSPRLRISWEVKVPVSWGVFRPTILMPASLCNAKNQAKLRWVFAHELTHLERGDAFSCILLGLGQAFYFYCPLYWWLRRQIRLCQEYLADAAAISMSAPPEDYAQFLLSLTAVPAVPANATGAIGNTSDLFRRVTMLLQDSYALEKSCPRWLVPVAATAMFVIVGLVSGLGIKATAGPASIDPPDVVVETPDEPDEPDTPPPPPRAPRPPIPVLPPLANLADLLKQLPPEQAEEIKKAQEKLASAQKELQEAMSQLRKVPKGAFSGSQGGVPGIGGPAGGAEIGGPIDQRFMHTYSTNNPEGGRLGIQVENIGPALADQLDISADKGLLITHVGPNSAAAKGGLKVNDILVEFDGNEVTNDAMELVKMVQKAKAKKPVTAVVLRKGQKVNIKSLVLPEVKKAQTSMAPAGQGGVYPVPPTPPEGAHGAFGGFAPFPPGQGGGKTGAPGAPDAGKGGFGGAWAPNPNGMGGAGFGQGFGQWSQGSPMVLAQSATGHNSVITSIFRNNDRFTARHQEGTLIITLTGNVVDGEAKVNDIHIQDGTETHNFKKVDKVTDRYRDKVKNLVEMCEKNSGKVEIRSR